MPDRRLTQAEMRKFIEEHKTGDIFNALRVFNEEKSPPSLHDLCLIELSAMVDGQTKIIIEQGRQIRALKLALRAHISRQLSTPRSK